MKTLKDIDYHSGCIAGDKLYVSKEDSKQEAIDWIIKLRNLKKGDHFIDNLFIIIDDEQDDTIQIINFIKHFFNVTEEEVKIQLKKKG